MAAPNAISNPSPIKQTPLRPESALLLRTPPKDLLQSQCASFRHNPHSAFKSPSAARMPTPTTQMIGDGGVLGSGQKGISLFPNSPMLSNLQKKAAEYVQRSGHRVIPTETNSSLKALTAAAALISQRQGPDSSQQWMIESSPQYQNIKERLKFPDLIQKPPEVRQLFPTAVPLSPLPKGSILSAHKHHNLSTALNTAGNLQETPLSLLKQRLSQITPSAYSFLPHEPQPFSLQDRCNVFSGSDIKLPLGIYTPRKNGFLEQSCPSSEVKCQSECSCIARAEANGPSFWRQSISRVVIPPQYHFQQEQSQCSCLNHEQHLEVDPYTQSNVIQPEKIEAKPLIPKKDPPKYEKVIVNGQERLIRRRKRKTQDQMELLEQEFLRDQEWSKKRLAELRQLTGLSESQIYKWGWDQRKKLAEQEGIVLQDENFPSSQQVISQSAILDCKETLEEEEVKIQENKKRDKKKVNKPSQVIEEPLAPVTITAPVVTNGRTDRVLRSSKRQ